MAFKRAAARRKARRSIKSQDLSSYSSISSEGHLEDYAENLMMDLATDTDNEQGSASESESESGSGSDSGSESGKSGSEILDRLEEIEIGAGPRIEDLLLSGSSDDDSQGFRSGAEILDRPPDEERVDVTQTFPVQVRGEIKSSGYFREPLAKAGHKSGHGRHTTTGMKGSVTRRDAHGRKIKQRPPTNRELKYERVQAKRSARDVQKAADLRRINRKLQQFVEDCGDIEAFPPMSKDNRDIVRKLASLYGLKYSEQQAKAKKVFIIVKPTKKTKLPEGQAKQQLLDLMADFQRPPATAELSQQKGQRGTHRRTSQGSTGRTPKPVSRPTPGSTSAKASIGFIASGSLNDLEPDGVVIVQPASGRLGQVQIEAPEHSTPGVTQVVDGSSPDLEAFAAAQRQEADCELASATPLPDPLHGKSVQTFGLGFLEEAGEQLIGDQDRGEAQTADLPDAVSGGGKISDNPPAMVPATDEGALEIGCPSSALLAVAEDRGTGNSSSEPPVYEALAGELQPSILRTKAQWKRAKKKLEKEDRRTARQQSVAVDVPTNTAVGLGYGQFERHTRGIGSKLMLQMGYMEGSGLGREKQGIAEPLKASQRPKKLGLGA